MNYTNLSVKIHSALADGGIAQDGRGYAAILLWYAVRAVDQSGKGYVDVNLKELAEAFKRSLATAKRYARQGQKLGFFRAVLRLKNGLTRIYYSSLHKVCQKLGLTNWGAVTEVSIAFIRRKYA